MQTPHVLTQNPRWMKGRVGSMALIALMGLALLVMAAGASLWWWATRPVDLSSPTVQMDVQAGQGAAQIAQAMVQAGVDVQPTLLQVWLRLHPNSRRIKAGTYEFKTGQSVAQITDQMVAGRVLKLRVTVLEGWTFAQLRAALAKAKYLRQTTKDMSDAQVMAALGKPDLHPEGQFFPDTYVYGKSTTDLQVLTMAHEALQERLDRAWDMRHAGLSLQDKYQLLTLASIVEKETGQAADRGKVSSVFHNRLRIGMRLQTDPTVIYGLGKRFDGNLRKVDLQTDTPYNTYTRAGLPPTPIALPSQAALMAAAQPEATSALYFVAKGNGYSQFSDNLSDHNKAVSQYILKQ